MGKCKMISLPLLKIRLVKAYFHSNILLKYQNFCKERKQLCKKASQNLVKWASLNFSNEEKIRLQNHSL